MARIHPGRFTAQIEGEFVVFVIGARINKLWKIHRWLPVVRAMGPMLVELTAHPDKGMLGARTMVAGRTVTVIQYWRSFEQLERFARSADELHLSAWRRFNQAVGTGGDVGIYHETFQVAPGGFECIYNNMPVYGLAAAGDHVPIGPRAESARQRITQP